MAVHFSENAVKTPRRVTLLALTILAGMLTACTGVPKGLNPVADFDLNRYNGYWLEVLDWSRPSCRA